MKPFWKKSTSVEVFKFVLYLFVPIGASVFYANPTFMHNLIIQLNLVNYPESGKSPPLGTDIDKFRDIKPK